MDSWELGDSSGTKNVVSNGTVATFRFPCSNNHVCTYYKSRLPPGYYKLEVWGAQGGACYYNDNFYEAQGMGGYSVGVVKLDKETDIYVYIGGKGEDGIKGSPREVNGGFNGGGNSPRDTNGGDDPGGAGGGASDIRINGNSWSNRVIVAGGGGGNGYYTGASKYVDCQWGGGLSGGPPRQNLNVYGTAADQTNGYQLGQGQDGEFDGSTSTGGGGGGYKGGFTYNNHGSGGGGSGYIGGVIDFNGIVKNTIPGNQYITQIDGTSRKGNSGHGAARITMLGYVITILTPMEPRYEPSSTILINVSLSSMGVGEQSTLSRSIQGTDEKVVDVHDDNGQTYVFIDKITLPSSPGNIEIKYSAKSKSGTVTNHSFSILVNKQPSISLSGDLRSKYIGHENVTILVTLRDDTYANITICECCRCLGSALLESYNQPKSVNITVEIPTYSIGETSELRIKAVDEFGTESDTKIHSFRIVDNTAPEIELARNINYVLPHFHDLKVISRMRDVDSSGKLCPKTVIDQVDIRDYNCIEISDQQFYVMTLRVPMDIYQDGVHNISIYCVDEHNARSNIIMHQFALDRNVKLYEYTGECIPPYQSYINKLSFMVVTYI